MKMQEMENLLHFFEKNELKFGRMNSIFMLTKAWKCLWHKKVCC